MKRLARWVVLLSLLASASACASRDQQAMAMIPSPPMEQPAPTQTLAPSPPVAGLSLTQSIAPSPTSPLSYACLFSRLLLATESYLEPPATIDSQSARRSIGLRIPPFPSGTGLVHVALLPAGEGRHTWPDYALYVVSQANAYVLWLALPYAEGDFRVTDAIPISALGPREVFIPFDCSRDSVYDMYLIAVASCPSDWPATDIREAWRIDPATDSLRPVSTRGIVCR